MTENGEMQMNGFLLLIPFFTIRFGLLALLDKGAVRRAAHFAPMRGGERVAYGVYQFSTAAVVLYPLFLTIRPGLTWHFVIGLPCAATGLALCIASIGHFARPDSDGLCTGGVYRLSRNPMYVSYFLYFTACALLTASPSLMVMVLVFQISAHWIILAEERWCRQSFGESYRRYCEQVRRYI